jgi:hypothetical protein
MGYYSELRFQCDIKSPQELKGLLAEIEMKKAAGIAENWEHELSYLTIDEEDSIICEDWYAKWYHDKEWIPQIAPYLSVGEIEFIGEDSERWGYLMENGKVFEQKYLKVKGEEIKSKVESKK